MHKHAEACRSLQKLAEEIYYCCPTTQATTHPAPTLQTWGPPPALLNITISYNLHNHAEACRSMQKLAEACRRNLSLLPYHPRLPPTLLPPCSLGGFHQPC